MPHHAALFTCNHWLAFELSVLRRLQFRSIALPWAGTPSCAVQLKRSGVRVSANSDRFDEYIASVAHVANDTERLTAEDLARLTDDAYVPRQHLLSTDLQSWFDAPEAWWFDNIRERAGQFETKVRRALALDLALRAGRYALSFDDATRHLRQPLSAVVRRLWERDPPPINNKQTNTAHMQSPTQFLAEQHVDLALIRLPRVMAAASRGHDASGAAWYDAWLRGVKIDEAEIIETRDDARRTPAFRSKTQYLNYVEELLARAGHLPQWAIVHAGDGFISTEELVETIRHVRSVKTIYTKDFSEWTGVRTNIITA